MNNSKIVDEAVLREAGIQLPMVVGITGADQVGKSAAADFFRQKRRFISMAFADPIKAGLMAMFAPMGLTPDHLEDGQLKEESFLLDGITPRKLMITLGTDWGRGTVDEDIWAALAEMRLRYYITSAATPGIVLSDVRFENEAKMILNYDNSHILRIQSPDPDKDKYTLPPIPEQLVSHTITNDPAKGLEEFHKELTQWVDTPRIAFNENVQTFGNA